MDSAFTALDSHFGMRPGLRHSPTLFAGSSLAMLFNCTGLVKEEFRAGAGLIRVVERVLTS
jgi:hypothetical protein